MSTKQCIQNFTPSIRKSALIRTLYLKETHTHTHIAKIQSIKC